MKKLFIGLMALGSVTCFASTSNCRVLISGKNFLKSLPSSERKVMRYAKENDLSFRDAYLAMVNSNGWIEEAPKSVLSKLDRKGYEIVTSYTGAFKDNVDYELSFTTDGLIGEKILYLSRVQDGFDIVKNGGNIVPHRYHDVVSKTSFQNKAFAALVKKLPTCAELNEMVINDEALIQGEKVSFSDLAK
jgi:hypothetical protein